MNENKLLQIIEDAAKEELISLSLSRSQLRELPPEIGQLSNLTSLDLSTNKLRELPPEIGQLSNLTTLNLRDNKLSALPPEIGQLSNLISLYFINNQLRELPPEIGQLFNLTYLNLSYNQLSALPPEIGQLSNLIYVVLSKNSLSALPPEIGQLSKLTEFHLIRNKLRELPPEIGQLSNLTTLNLRDNKLRELPPEIGQLSNLTTLNLNKTNLRELPPEIGQLSNLTTLHLNKTNLRELPPEIGQLSKLATLNLINTELRELPPEIGQLSNLTTLNLSGSQLRELPPEIGQLSNLTTLNLSHSQLRELPPEIGQLPDLTTLNLDDNTELSALPPEIGQLSTLTVLHLNKTKLSGLPPEIVQLSNLNTLILSNVELKALPPEIGQLPKLTELYLNNNQLNALSPEIIGQLTNLTYLDLDNNPLEMPPAEVARQGIEAIRDYFRQQEEVGIDYLYEAKLLIVGEPGAGKTTLTRKIKDPDAPMPEEDETTKGIDIETWKFPQLDKPNFQVNIWDFGGQAIYHATHRFFLTRRSLYVLVADTRKDDTDFYYWLNIIEVLSEDSPVLIIKNEKDDRPREINEKQLRGQFVNLKEVSQANLKTNRGLAEICTHIQQYISNLPHVGDSLPKTWMDVRRELESNPHNYISLNEYLEICERNGFKKHQDKLQLSTYLHELGICLHYQDDPLLNKTVILKTDWCTAAVYKVLDTNQVIANLGRFTRADLDEIWVEEEYVLMQDELLQMMVKFKLCYPIPDTPDTYILPQLLTENQPDYVWNEADNLLLRYSYEFMPKGIVWQFMVVMHRFIGDQRCAWRSGVVLEDDQTQAEVIEKYGLRRIEIRVSGKHKRDFLTRVRHELEKIHRQYPGLKYDELIPCNCDTCRDSQKPYFYKFESLRKRIFDKKYEIECDKSYEMVDVLALIDDIESKQDKIADELGIESEAESDDSASTDKLEEKDQVTHMGELQSITSLVILVHGFGADEKEFWGATPTALMTHPSIRNNYDVEYWGYQTTKAPVPFWSKLLQKLGIGLRTQTLEQLGQNLWSDLREWNNQKNYSHIKLLGHSMGGLVVASAVGYGLLLEEDRDLDLISKLQGIAFVATPLGGADLARIVKIFYKAFGENVHRRDLEEDSVHRKKIVTRFIQLALEEKKLPLKIFRAANDTVVNEEELTRPLPNGSYELDVLRGGHSACIQNLEAGQENLKKLVRWITS